MKQRLSAGRREARYIVRKVRGKPLPPFAMIHHIDGYETNNAYSNLVVCEDMAYYKLLHRRTEALKACGNVHWRRCKYCNEHDAIENLYISPNDSMCYHRKCRNKYARELYASNQKKRR